MASRGHSIGIVAPVPRVPPFLVWGRRARFRSAPVVEARAGIEIRRPRYLHVPGIVEHNARRFARVGGRAVAAMAVDVVVADYAWPAAAAVPGLVATGVPAVVSARGSDLRIARSRPALERMLRSALAASSGWLATARHLVDELDTLGGRAGAGWLVPNGVDADTFRPRPRASARARLGVPRGTLVLVVGQLIPRKNPLLALRAFAHAAPALGEPMIAFVGDGPLRGRLAAGARSLGIERLVRIVGEQAPERLADWYAAADCLLHCSSFEGRPNVVLEALASGLPVLATRTEGAAELLAALPELLWDGGEPRALAARLVQLIAAPPSPDRLVASAQPYTWAASCELLERFLASALAPRGEP